MSDNEFSQIEKLLPYKMEQKGHTYIRDEDLQIHVTLEKENPTQINFQNIYTLHETGSIRNEELIPQTKKGNELNLAMDEAQNAFNSMMQIREQLSEAYKEFIQMQS